jgi:hypothetical protein
MKFGRLFAVRVRFAVGVVNQAKSSTGREVPEYGYCYISANMRSSIGNTAYGVRLIIGSHGSQRIGISSSWYWRKGVQAEFFTRLQCVLDLTACETTSCDEQGRGVDIVCNHPNH